jgi:hypothetical protein
MLAFVCVAGVALSSPALAQQHSLAGEWTGGYISADGADVNAFDVKLSQAGSTLAGTIYEANSFGDPQKALFLTSTLTGSVQNDVVTFTKTYDGSGGVSHSVSYTGRLEPNGRRIRGAFNAAGATGTFEMVR